MALGVLLLLGACANGTSPEAPEGADGTVDPVLAEGRSVWVSSCSRCHGSSGGGGAGPAVHSARDARPSQSDMIEVVTEGRGAMPQFGTSLSDDEIEAVVRYIHEVL